ncbi:hypothetical protein KDV89_21805, partial [Providencia stuartii]|uniref:hypothetical protein n=1 Tax=Providencia stuartii TaxID=588 RepID=UPI00332036D2
QVVTIACERVAWSSSPQGYIESPKRIANQISPFCVEVMRGTVLLLIRNVGISANDSFPSRLIAIY